MKLRTIIGILMMLFVIGGLCAKPIKPAKQCRLIGKAKVKPFRMKVMPVAKPGPTAIIRPISTAKFRS